MDARTTDTTTTRLVRLFTVMLLISVKVAAQGSTTTMPVERESSEKEQQIREATSDRSIKVSEESGKRPPSSQTGNAQARDSVQQLIDDRRQPREYEPENLDLKFRLAAQLSWRGQREEARDLAEQIVKANPQYFDAQILIVRIDLWDGKLDEAFARISKVLARQPKNRDAVLLWTQIRLAQAQQLMKEKKNAEARKVALQVTEVIKDCWDAQLIVARIDAWQGRYDAALRSVFKVLTAEPKRRDAIELWADIGIWSQKGGQASKALDRLEHLYEVQGANRKALADIAYRRAQLALQQNNALRAFRFAGLALEYDPTHSAAREIRKRIRLAAADLSGQFEGYPVRETNRKYGAGTTVAATLLPASVISPTLLYEYIYRFTAHNHRLTVRADWRVTDKLTLIGSVRSGIVEVIPREGLLIGADYQINETYGAALNYTLDAMKWPGMLHRVQPTARVNLPRNFRVDANYNFGVLAYCGRSDILHGVHIQPTWAPPPFEISVRYDFGMELESLLVPSDSNFGQCPSDAPAEDEYKFRLGDLRYHEMGAQVLFNIDTQTFIRAGYGIQIRVGGGMLHMANLGIRRWF